MTSITANLMQKILIILIFLITLSLGFVKRAMSETLNNNIYNIKIDQIKTTTPVSSKEFKSDSKTFYKNDDNPISLTLSQDLLEFGDLSPTNPVVRLLFLTGETNSEKNGAIFGLENHELSFGNAIIPDTTCDNGSCTETQSSSWSSLLTYGFGYRCDDLIYKGCIDFLNKDTYKRFANKKNNKNWEIISNFERKTKNQISLKLNTSDNQEKGLYENEISFIAIPGY